VEISSCQVETSSDTGRVAVAAGQISLVCSSHVLISLHVPHSSMHEDRHTRAVVVISLKFTSSCSCSLQGFRKKGSFHSQMRPTQRWEKNKKCYLESCSQALEEIRM